jgi:hypothetical protein
MSAFYTSGNNSPRGNRPLAKPHSAPSKHQLRPGSAPPPARTTAGPAPKVDKPKIIQETKPSIMRRPLKQGPF